MMVDNSFSTSSSVLSSKSTWAHFPICKMGFTLPPPKVTREYETVDSGSRWSSSRKLSPFCLSRHGGLPPHPYTDEKPQQGWVIIQGHTAKHLTPKMLLKEGLIWSPATRCPITAAWMDLLARVFFTFSLFNSSSLNPGRPASGRKKMSRLVWAGQIPLHNKPAGESYGVSVGIESQRIHNTEVIFIF